MFDDNNDDNTFCLLYFVSIPLPHRIRQDFFFLINNIEYRPILLNFIISRCSINM